MLQDFFLKRFCLFILVLSLLSKLDANLNERLIHLLKNNECCTFLNSVDFDPTLNRFCVTFTHHDRIAIYQLDQKDEVCLTQILENPSAALQNPQYALFSKDGKSLIVSNWQNETFTLYQTDENGLFAKEPFAIIPFPLPINGCKPHGMALSPNGDILAVAFGASTTDPKALALFEIHHLETKEVQFKLKSFLQNSAIEEGIPKGITFSPNGASLIVTLSETDSIATYDIDWVKKEIIPSSEQLLKGASYHLSRPEDIKFNQEGSYCIVSNSHQNSVTCYLFDRENNCFTQNQPFHFIENLEMPLSFPHGLALSSDGNYLIVTQFGNIQFNKEYKLVSWANEFREAILIFKLM